MVKFCLFVGIGVVYSWFSNIELNGNFVRDINENFGSVFVVGVGKLGVMLVEGKVLLLFMLVYNIGVSYVIDKYWGFMVMLMYMLLKIYLLFVIKVVDGLMFVIMCMKLKVDLLIMFVGIFYKFWVDWCVWCVLVVFCDWLVGLFWLDGCVFGGVLLFVKRGGSLNEYL